MSYYPPENEAGFNAFTARIKELIDCANNQFVRKKS